MVLFVDALGTASADGKSIHRWAAGEVMRISVLAPGQEVWHPIERLRVIDNPQDLPPARVTCRWHDGTGSRSDDFIVDCSPLIEAMD
jgi:hypothetical protein